MGISFNVSNNQNSSYLFQNLSSGSGGMGNLDFLSNYASIKNGSYGKLMKAYYGAEKSYATDTSAKTSANKNRSNNVLDRIFEEKRNPKVSKDVQKANADLVTGLSSLRSSVSTLQDSKTFVDTENGQSGTDKMVSAMKAYVSNYNSVVTAAKDSTLSGKTAYVANMMSSSAANADNLSEIGVTINSNGTLELNEAKLREAGASKVQELFSADNIMSYGSMIASRVKFAGSSSTTGSTNATDNTQTNNSADVGASSLKEDSLALASDKLYEKVKDKDGNETNQYNIDKIISTAKSFVKNYNKMFDAAESSANSGVLSNLSYIREKTARNEDALKQFGFSVDQKGRMKLDEDVLKNSDMSKVQQFFKNYGSSIATNASLVDYYMTTQANAASGYTNEGAYNVQGSSRYAGAM